MTLRPPRLALLPLTFLLALTPLSVPEARSDDARAETAPERAHGRIKKEEAAQVLKQVDAAMRSRDTRALGDLIAAKFAAHILEELDNGDTELAEQSRAEYLEALRTRWSSATDYVYDRRNEVLGTYGSGKIALVRSDVSEQFEIEGVKSRTVSHQTVSLEVVGDRVLITKITAFAKHTPPVF